MESVLTLLLLRFALIAGVLVLLALAVFTIALLLKRRGKLGSVRHKAAPVVHAAATAIDNRNGWSSRRRNGKKLAGTVLRSAARFLDDGPQDRPKRGDNR